MDPVRAKEIREMESSVWDLTKHLIHPAFVYVVLQVAFWCALERNAAFGWNRLPFLGHTLIHAAQFVGAWGVFYGTLLRDMRFEFRVVTVVVWATALLTAAAWLWPDAGSASAEPGLWTLLVADLTIGLAGWVLTMRSWGRARRSHESNRPGASP
jgi:hypothetical protein